MTKNQSTTNPEENQDDILLERIVRNKGQYIGDELTEHYKNKYVVTALQAGCPPISNYVGRVAQVRKESGQFGSDQVLMRHMEGNLSCHENQAFFSVTDRVDIEDLDKLFKDVPLEDYTEPYTIGTGQAESGFLIPSKVKDGNSTPMRDIKNSISELIFKDKERKVTQ